MTSPTPWEYSPSKNGCRDCIYDSAGNVVVFDVGHLDGPLIVRSVNSLPALLAACKAAEHRYRSMWFDISSTPKPVSNARGEWEMLKAAIAAAEEPT